mmetsp:Transcript_44847/g.105669  ORF Transcript_44847/g.105669 Transcript_44847/m.105669 type:complete len:259 (-) Transcript_44847:505-1281(-)
MGLFGDRRRQALDQHLGDLGRHVFAALGDRAHGLYQAGRVAALVDIAIGAGTQRADGVLVLGVHRDDQGSNRRALVLEHMQHIQAGPARHVDVQHQHIAGIVLAQLVQQAAQLGVVTGLTDDLDVAVVGQGVPDAAADQAVVVAQDDADHARPQMDSPVSSPSRVSSSSASMASAASGTLRIRLVPPPGAADRSTQPPTVAARSCRPRMPKERSLARSPGAMPRPLSRISRVSTPEPRLSSMSTRVARACLDTLVSAS